MTDSQTYIYHVTSLEEVGWGIALIAITMMLHAFGMLVTLTVGGATQNRLRATAGFFTNIRVLVVTSWVIVFVHLGEVAIWAGFFVWREAMPSMSAAYYYSLMQYVTVGSELTLPVRWRLLGGLIGIAGLLTFAWSTTVLLRLAQRFEERQMHVIASRRRMGSTAENANHDAADDRGDASVALQLPSGKVDLE
jgi:hypothetical protein